MAPRVPNLAHGWQLMPDPRVLQATIRDFIRPAVRAVPTRMAQQLGYGRVMLGADFGPNLVSRWTATDRGLDVSVATSGREDHDIVMELLICLGQALWERLSVDQRTAYWRLLDEEIGSGVVGEIDEEASQAKRALLANRNTARSRVRLERYGCSSFAGTAAEYVHSLWHDVSVRSGPDHLPPAQLRRRLELLSRWFPPDRGYRLFPRSRGRRHTRGADSG
jgi:hypothetical protein